MKWINYLVWLTFTITLPLLIEAAALQATAHAAADDASLSGIKALYGGDAGERGASLQPQTLSIPNGGIKPTLEAISCPDGRTRSALEILRLARAANPELPIWDEPELAAALDPTLNGERGVWQWIKDHVKLSINAFGLQFQVHSGSFCGQLNVAWGTWETTWEPC
jgi:hypothetical protein